MIIAPKFAYYALTEEESHGTHVQYDSNVYTLKGLNLDIGGLRRFIATQPKVSKLIKYYTVVPLHYFNIDDTVILDKEFNMITVKIPFKFPITNLIPFNALFHGTPDRIIGKIKPNRSEVINNELAVFSGEFWVGLSNVCKWQDSDFIHGVHNNVPYIAEKYEGAFKKIYSKGGYLYTLPFTDFKHDRRLGDYEYISKHAITPLKETFIKDPIKELISIGVTMVPYKDSVSAINW